jgi:serine/threonine protein kinase
VLIDFGAARQTLACDTPMLKPMYTPGFASPEHYNPARAARPVERHLQRRRLDVCLHLGQHATTGRRAAWRKDRLVPAMVRWEGQYSDQLLETIDWCLCLNHRYRPQSVFALQKALTEAVVPPTPLPRPAKETWLRQVVGKLKRTRDA